MIVAPHRHRPGHEHEDLTGFLEFCRAEAVRRGRTVFASVTVPVSHIDPLAVLLKMRRAGEPWFFRERPADDTSLAALDSVYTRVFRGAERFAEAAEAARAVFADTVAAGDPKRPFGGPHAIVAAEFADEAPLTLFIPRRMVARIDGSHTAVANAAVGPETDCSAEAARILAAHARFADFDYGSEEIPAPRTDASPDLDPTEGEAEYAARVARHLEDIARNTMTKIVPARIRDRHAEHPFDTARALERLRAAHPGSHTFSFGLGDGDEWLGATPETLLRITDGTLVTEALAGTAPRADQAAEDARLEAALLADEKIRREQRAVTDELIERLRGLDLTPVYPDSPRIMRLPHARHLHTPIRAALPPDIDALIVAGALHPTPAVAGTPRDLAMLRLKETEPFDREHFAGTAGWIDARGDAHLQVNLRCAKVSGAHARLYAGAGIVHGSKPDDEARETTLKLRTVDEVLR